MLLGSPEHTNYDLRFRLLNIPIRVHPWFWLVMLWISGRADNFRAALVFVGAAFLSILVHELGHALSSRHLGREPGGIVLYAMGGFCYFNSEHQSPWKRLIVLACGPGAGFLLFGATILAMGWLWQIRPADAVSLIGIGPGDWVRAAVQLPRSPVVRNFVNDLLWINLWWGVFNLFPIWPLDGGQMTGIALGMVNPRNGVRWGHVVSLLTAGSLAIWKASDHDWVAAVWIGYFGLVNYQILQSMHFAYHSSQGDPGRW